MLAAYKLFKFEEAVEAGDPVHIFESMDAKTVGEVDNTLETNTDEFPSAKGNIIHMIESANRSLHELDKENDQALMTEWNTMVSKYRQCQNIRDVDTFTLGPFLALDEAMKDDDEAVIQKCFEELEYATKRCHNPFAELKTGDGKDTRTKWYIPAKNWRSNLLTYIIKNNIDKNAFVFEERVRALYRMVVRRIRQCRNVTTSPMDIARIRLLLQHQIIRKETPLPATPRFHKLQRSKSLVSAKEKSLQLP